MLRQHWGKWFIFVAVLLLVISGCSKSNSQNEMNEIDPPPPGSNRESDGKENEMSEEQPEAQSTMEVILYFKDDEGYVVPLSVRIPASESVARRSLEYMVDGGPVQELLPEGFSALIPQGTIIDPVNIHQQVATVDLSEHFASYNAQDERKILEAITWTLTGFSTIDRVQLRIKGHDLKEMPVAGTPMDEPLSRVMGINLENVPGVQYGQSTPVTLYFQNRMDTQFNYYVPVTRMVSRTPDVVGAAVHELIKGPLGNGSLHALFNPAAEVLMIDHDVDHEVITLDFGDELLAHADGPYDEAITDAYESIVMSLWENMGQGQIRILINGESRAVMEQDQQMSVPVNRTSGAEKSKL